MIALYMRLSAADGDLDGRKAESNSITNQRKILEEFVRRDPVLSVRETMEFVDDGFSGSNFDRPGVRKMLDMCKEGVIDTVVVKDLSRFAREEVDSGTYIEQVFPFLSVRFISLGEGIDTLRDDIDRLAPDIAIRNIANAAYCRDTSIRIQSTLHTKWRRGMRPHAVAPFGYIVDPNDPMRLAIFEEAAPAVRRIFELASGGMPSTEIAKALTNEGFETPGALYRRLRMYGYDKKPVAKSSSWNSTRVDAIIRNPVYKGTLVAGKTHRVAMSKKQRRPVPEEERYVTEGAHAAIIDEGAWEKAQECPRSREKARGSKRSAARSPFAYGLLRRAECGHGMTFRRRKVMEDFFMCTCDCAEGDVRRVEDSAIADAIANALRSAAALAGDSSTPPAPKREKPAYGCAAKPTAEPSSSLLAAYERYVNGKATIEDVRSLSQARAKHGNPVSRAIPNGSPFFAEPRSERLKDLVQALEERRFEEVDRGLLRSEVECVLVHEGPRLEVVLAG